MTAPLPDWGKPLGLGLWQAHGRPDLALALPVGLSLEREDGSAGYAIEAFRLAADEPEGFGVLSVRFVGFDDAAARTEAARHQYPHVAVSFAGLGERGYCTFQAAAALEASAQIAAVPLAPSGSGLGLVLRLEGPALSFVRRIGAAGTQPVVATVAAEYRGYAACAPGEARIDGTALAAQLGGEGAPPVSRSALLAALAGGAWDGAVTVTGSAGADAGEAVVDRLTGLALTLAPPDPAADEPLWACHAGSLAGTVLTVPLDDERIVPRAVLLKSPALGPPDVSERLVEDQVTAFDTGFAVLSLAANVLDPRVGAELLGVDIAIPAHPPERPQAIRKTIEFAAGNAVATLPVRLAPGEPVAFDYQAFVVTMAGGSAFRLEGPWLHNEDAQLTLPATAWPVQFVVAEANASLLAAGSVELTLTGTPGGSQWSARALLSAAQPRLTVARPRDLATMAADARLLPADGGTPLAIPLDPAAESFRFDLAALPQAGPQTARAAGDGPLGGLPAFEYAGEDEIADPAAVRLVRLGPAQPAAELRWLPASPFRAGFRSRWTTPGAAWSDPLPAGTTLRVRAGDAALPWPGAREPAAGTDGQSLDLAGVELLAEAPGHYRFRPTAPSLAAGADGKPAVGVMEFSGGAMVQVTAEWTVSPARLARLAEGLTQRDGTPPQLDPAFDTVTETALLVADANGALLPVATGTALGAPPQTSLLTATLAGDALAALKRALAGERGCARLRYTVDASDPASAVAEVAHATAGEGHAAFAAASASTSTSRRHTLTSEADLADLITPHGT